MKKENKQRERAFERFIDQAMEDEYWLELITMRTGLPLKKKRQEIAEIFKRHVILMGKETDIYSVKEAKNYFANYTRKGTQTHKELIQVLQRQGAAARFDLRRSSIPCGSSGGTAGLPCNEEDLYRYEEVDLETGERSYCGIRIPQEAPPRPNENAVWNNARWEL